MYKLLKTEGKARRAEFHTVHGVVQTPAFMNVGTSAAIKGGISSYDLIDLKCQVELCNTYHLHVRPGDELIYRRGGLWVLPLRWHLMSASKIPLHTNTPKQAVSGQHAGLCAARRRYSV